MYPFSPKPLSRLGTDFYTGWLIFPRWLGSKESGCKAGGLGFDPWVGRPLGRGHGNQLWYPCLEKPMDWGAWQAMARKVTESDMTEVTAREVGIQFTFFPQQTTNCPQHGYLKVYCLLHRSACHVSALCICGSDLLNDCFPLVYLFISVTTLSSPFLLHPKSCWLVESVLSLCSFKSVAVILDYLNCHKHFGSSS